MDEQIFQPILKSNILTRQAKDLLIWYLNMLGKDNKKILKVFVFYNLIIIFMRAESFICRVRTPQSIRVSKFDPVPFSVYWCCKEWSWVHCQVPMSCVHVFTGYREVTCKHSHLHAPSAFTLIQRKPFPSLRSSPKRGRLCQFLVGLRHSIPWNGLAHANNTHLHRTSSALYKFTQGFLRAP